MFLVSSSLFDNNMAGEESEGSAIWWPDGATDLWATYNVFDGNTTPQFSQGWTIIDEPGQEGNQAAAIVFLSGTWRPYSGQPWLADGNPALPDPEGGTSTPGAYGGPTAAGWDLDGDGARSWWEPSDDWPGLPWDCDDLDATVMPGAGCEENLP